MTTEIQSAEADQAGFEAVGLAVNEIDRSGGISSDAGRHEDGGAAEAPAESAVRDAHYAAYKELQARGMRGERLTDVELQRMTQLYRRAEGRGADVAGVMPAQARDANADRPITPNVYLEMELEKQLAPISERETEEVQAKAVAKGLDTTSGEFLANLGMATGLPRDAVDSLVARAAQHFPGGEVTLVEDADIPEYQSVINGAYPGGWDAFGEHSNVVRAWLDSIPNAKHGSVMKLLDHYKYSQSSLALDPRALSVLYRAARRAGFGQ